MPLSSRPRSWSPSSSLLWLWVELDSRWGTFQGVCFEDDENQEANSFGNNPSNLFRLLIWTAVGRFVLRARTNEAKRHAIRPRYIDSTPLFLAFGVHQNAFVLVRILSCLAFLNAAVMAAKPGFLLGADYSEWLYPTANEIQIATDGSGALYILSVFPGTSLSSPSVFRVTKL